MESRPSSPPPVIPEVLPPETRVPPVGDARTPPADAGRPAPFHPVAALLLIVVDSLWNFPDFLVVSWVLTIPLSFLSVFLTTYMAQRYLGRDLRRTALAKALALGTLAAIPTSIASTPVGLALLAWAGIRSPLNPFGRR